MGSLVSRLFITAGFAGAILAVARQAYPDAQMYADIAALGEAVIVYESLFGRGWGRQLARALLWFEILAAPLSVILTPNLEGPRMTLLATTAALAWALLILGEFTFMPRRKPAKSSGSGSRKTRPGHDDNGSAPELPAG
jgi:hypothetical protein